MQSLTETIGRCADSLGIVRVNFKPGTFAAGTFNNSGVAPGYYDPGCNWLDARVIQCDSFGLALASGDLETFIPMANIASIVRRPRG